MKRRGLPSGVPVDVTAESVRQRLKDAGVVCHLVSTDDKGDLIIFLEANRGDADLMARIVRGLPGIVRVSESGKGSGIHRATRTLTERNDHL